jgi:hypothetical protein
MAWVEKTVPFAILRINACALFECVPVSQISGLQFVLVFIQANLMASPPGKPACFCVITSTAIIVTACSILSLLIGA